MDRLDSGQHYTQQGATNARLGVKRITLIGHANTGEPARAPTIARYVSTGIWSLDSQTRDLRNKPRPRQPDLRPAPWAAGLDTNTCAPPGNAHDRRNRRGDKSPTTTLGPTLRPFAGTTKHKMPVVELLGTIFGSIIAMVPKTAAAAGAGSGTLAKMTTICEQVRV